MQYVLWFKVERGHSLAVEKRPFFSASKPAYTILIFAVDNDCQILVYFSFSFLMQKNSEEIYSNKLQLGLIQLCNIRLHLSNFLMVLLIFLKRLQRFTKARG